MVSIFCGSIVLETYDFADALKIGSVALQDHDDTADELLISTTVRHEPGRLPNPTFRSYGMY